MEGTDIARLAQILTELSTMGQSGVMAVEHNWPWVHRDDVNRLALEGLALLQGKKEEV